MKLSGEDLSRYSNKVESVVLMKCPYYHHLTKKVMSQHFSELVQYNGGKTAGIENDMKWCEEMTLLSAYVTVHDKVYILPYVYKYDFVVTTRK